jgi:hypothetical protein
MTNHEFSLHLVLCFDQFVSPKTAFKTLESFETKMNRSLLGPEWAKRAPYKRLIYYGSLDYRPTTVRWHLLVDHKTPKKVASLAAEHWKKLYRTSDVQFSLIQDADDPAAFQNSLSEFFLDNLTRHVQRHLVLPHQFSSRRPYK